MEKNVENEKKIGGVEELIQKGKKNNNRLASDDIEEYIEQLDLDMDAVDKLYEELENNGVSWQSEADPAEAAEDVAEI